MRNSLESRTGFYQIADPRAIDSEFLDGMNYLCLVTSLMQACDEFWCAVLRWNGSAQVMDRHLS